MTVGAAQPLEELSEVGRKVMTGLGFMETMTLVLTNEREHYELLRVPVRAGHLRIENPASVEQAMPREQLLTGLLSTFRVNVTREMPQSTFETGDCFVPDPAAETGTRVIRKLGAGMAGPRTGFAEARSALEALAREMGLLTEFRPLESAEFIPGRAAEVFVRRGGAMATWGRLGEVNPETLEGFGITQPVSVFEVELG